MRFNSNPLNIIHCAYSIELKYIFITSAVGMTNVLGLKFVCISDIYGIYRYI